MTVYLVRTNFGCLLRDGSQIDSAEEQIVRDNPGCVIKSIRMASVQEIRDVEAWGGYLPPAAKALIHKDDK